jgi:hypothetical protein
VELVLGIKLKEESVNLIAKAGGVGLGDFTLCCEELQDSRLVFEQDPR